MKYINYIVISAFLIIVSCEEQPVTIPEMGVPVTDKVVLIEELTGVSCPNCPRGVAAVEAIYDLFPGKVVSYGIHGDLQTQPKSNSKYDFRNQDAFELEESLKPFFGKPAAAINRTLFDGQDFISSSSVDQWANFVEEELLEPQVANIVIDNIYDEDTRTVTINIGVGAIVDIAGSVDLHVSITESHLIDPQDDVNTTIQEFEHNHVLKDILSQLSGDGLASSGMSANENITRQYTYTVPQEVNGEWIPENMEVIAFITSGAQDGEVLQAGSAYLK